MSSTPIIYPQHISYHNRIFDWRAGTGATSTSVDPLPDSWLAARMADLTPDLQVCQSWGLIAESFHSLQSLPVSCFHVILGFPGPCFPSTCMSKAVLTAELERYTCPCHRSLLSIRMRSRSSMPSRTSSSLDLVVAMSWGLTLQISLIIALSFRCRRWRFGLPSVVCHPRGVQFPGTVYICRQGLLSNAWAHCSSCAPSACSHCRRCCCCPLQCDRRRMETRLNSAGGPGPYRRSWSLSFLHLLSVLSSPLLLSKSRASWHIPQAYVFG